MPKNFPPPWSVEDNGTSWAVSDANGFTITWMIYDAHPALSSKEAMTREQAYAMAVNFARLPVLLKTATQD